MNELKCCVMDEIIIFESYYNPIEANIVKSKLDDNEVQCFLSDENSVTMNPLYNQALGGVKLHIFKRDLELARSILGADDALKAGHEEIEGAEICPNCGSNHVAYVQATKKRFGILTVLVSFLIMIYPFHANKAHHCFDCQHEF